MERLVERLTIKPSESIQAKLKEFCKDLPVFVPKEDIRFPGVIKEQENNGNNGHHQ